MFKTNQPKETMTLKQIQNKLVQAMKKDIELKKYVKDIEDLNTKQFKILINIFKKFKTNKQKKGTNEHHTIRERNSQSS